MPPPIHLGKYEIRREIGKGSMGVVYEAFDPFIERRVAIKIIRQDQLGPSQVADLLARLRREAQAAGRLNHPGIVGIYDYGEDSTLGGGGVAFITMELIDGKELKDAFDNGQRFSQAEIVRIMGEVLAALQHAHERGVTHRDVKPSNVILLRDGGVKVADFGVARLDSSELTQAGTLIGTPMYMSPEQILGLPVDGRSDVFSCGVMLYQFLTGEKPFTGSITTVMQKVLHDEPVPVTQLNTALSPEWDAVLRKALAKKPEDRYQSASAMADGIRSAAQSPREIDDDATIARPMPTVVPVPAPAPVLAMTPAPAAASMRDSRPGGVRWAALAAGVAFTGLAAAALWWWLPSAAPRPAPDSVVRLDPMPEPASAAAAANPMPAASASGPALPPATAPKISPSAAAPKAAPPASVPKPAPPPVAAATAVRPAPIASAAKTSPATAVVTAKPLASAPAPGAAVLADWRQRITNTEAARGTLTLASALATLLAPLSDDERALAADFDAQLRRLPAHHALVLGVQDGQFRATWQRRAPSAERAAALARKRCDELPARACRAVVIDGTFLRDGLLTVAREFDADSPPAVVRKQVLQAFERSLAGWRRDEAAALAALPASTPASMPGRTTTSAPPSAPAPANAGGAAASMPGAAALANANRAEWTQAQARLRSEPRLSLAGALAILLHATATEDVERLEHFQTRLKQFPWKSALALGEKNGYLSFGYAHSHSRTDWANEAAVKACSRGAATPCGVVMSNGDFDAVALQNLAPRLGTKSQQLVRENFMRDLRRTFR